MAFSVSNNGRLYFCFVLFCLFCTNDLPVISRKNHSLLNSSYCKSVIPLQNSERCNVKGVLHHGICSFQHSHTKQRVRMSAAVLISFPLKVISRIKYWFQQKQSNLWFPLKGEGGGSTHLAVETFTESPPTKFWWCRTPLQKAVNMAT